MENGVVIDTEEGSPQGGNLSPLLANVYLNEFDQEFLKRDVPCIRYADDIVLLAKSRRASERLLESSTKYLEERLKLTVNREKSRTVSVFAIQNFKFLGFALGRNGKGIYVRVHSKTWKKFKSRLKELSSRKRCQSIKPSLEKIKVYARGWLNYYGIASMKNNIATSTDGSTAEYVCVYGNSGRDRGQRYVISSRWECPKPWQCKRVIPDGDIGSQRIQLQ